MRLAGCEGEVEEVYEKLLQLICMGYVFIIITWHVLQHSWLKVTHCIRRIDDNGAVSHTGRLLDYKFASIMDRFTERNRSVVCIRTRVPEI